jgi:septal ring factor EnvC (AmiA/AmiB activator)
VATGLPGAAVVVDANGQLGTTSSSRRFKDDIKDMGDASSDLMKLRPVTFRYKQAQDDGSHPLQYGLVAEEVAEVNSGLVQFDKDGQPQTVLYHVLPAMLLNEAQKQHQHIDAQEKVIQSQQEQIQSQQEQIQSQQEQLKAQEERLRKLEAILSSRTN